MPSFLDNVNIVATNNFTSSALTLMSDLRALSSTVTEWTASAGKVNYYHVGEWYFSGSFSQSASPHKYDTSLSSHWNFDSTGSGENELVDVSGNGYSGSFGSQTYLDTNGLHGNAVNFDGSGDYITITPSLTYKAIDNFTFTCWFRLAGAGGGSYSRIVKSLYREDRMTIIQFVNSNSKLRIRRNDDDEEENIGYNISTMKNEWHFLAVVRNAGGWSASLDANSTLTPIIDAGDGIVDFELIGATGPQGMSGSIDSLRFYDVELPQAAITSIYNLNGAPATAKQSTPQTEGYEVVCGMGREARWAYHTNSPFALASQASVTKSIKTIRGIGDTHQTF